MGVLPRVYICDDNPRMRQLLAARLAGTGQVIGSGRTTDEAVEAAEQLEPDVVVLDFRTAVGNLPATIGAVKAARPSATVVVHTGVPRNLIEAEVRDAGGVYSPKYEPEHLVTLVRKVNPAAVEAAFRGS